MKLIWFSISQESLLLPCYGGCSVSGNSKYFLYQLFSPEEWSVNAFATSSSLVVPCMGFKQQSSLRISLLSQYLLTTARRGTSFTSTLFIKSYAEYRCILQCKGLLVPYVFSPVGNAPVYSSSRNGYFFDPVDCVFVWWPIKYDIWTAEESLLYILSIGEWLPMFSNAPCNFIAALCSLVFGGTLPCFPYWATALLIYSALIALSLKFFLCLVSKLRFTLQHTFSQQSAHMSVLLWNNSEFVCSK